MGLQGSRVRSMFSYAPFVVHWGIAGVLKPDVESNDVMQLPPSPCTENS